MRGEYRPRPHRHDPQPACECNACRHHYDQVEELADAEELALDLKHPIHHHHIDDDDELEHAETELAWEEIEI